MALHTLHRVLAVTAILFFFGCGLWALKQPGRVPAAMGVISLALSGGTAACVIRANYRVRIPGGR